MGINTCIGYIRHGSNFNMRNLCILLMIVVAVVEAKHKHHSRRFEPDVKEGDVKRAYSTYPTNVQVASEALSGKYYRGMPAIGTKPRITTSLVACTDECKYEQTCQCASYDKTRNHCWLHAKCTYAPVATTNSVWFAIAPVAFNERQKRRYPGCPIIAAPEATNTEDCAQKCAWKEDCVAAVYRPARGTCTLCRTYGAGKKEGYSVSEDVVALERVPLKLNTFWQRTPNNLDNGVSGVVLPECLQMCVKHGAACCGASFRLASNTCWTHSECSSPAVLLPAEEFIAYTP